MSAPGWPWCALVLIAACAPVALAAAEPAPDEEPAISDDAPPQADEVPEATEPIDPEIAAAIERAEREPAPELAAEDLRRAQAALDAILAEAEGPADGPLLPEEAAELARIQREFEACLALLDLGHGRQAVAHYLAGHDALDALTAELRERVPRRIARLADLHLAASRALAREGVLRLPDDGEAAPAPAPEDEAAGPGL